MKDTESLQRRLAYLEFANDQLFSELREIDNLLKLVGFPEGIRTVKRAALELLENGGEPGQARDQETA